jgi:hypothetical protein
LPCPALPRFAVSGKSLFFRKLLVFLKHYKNIAENFFRIFYSFFVKGRFFMVKIHGRPDVFGARHFRSPGPAEKFRRVLFVAAKVDVGFLQLAHAFARLLFRWGTGAKKDHPKAMPVNFLGKLKHEGHDENKKDSPNEKGQK